MSFATRNHHTTIHILQTHSTTNILKTPLVIMDKLICVHERCKTKAMKHGNGYCNVHGKKSKCTYPQCSNYIQSDGLCESNMAIERKNAITPDAPTMPSGMVSASVTVQSAIAQSLGAASHCFGHGSADLTSGVFGWRRWTFWQQQM